MASKDAMYVCMRCKCKKGGPPCDICANSNHRCQGTCLCCEGFRKSFLSMIPGIRKQIPVSICNRCECTNKSKHCKTCVLGSLSCPGTCECCSFSRKHKTSLKRLDDGFVDKVLLDSVISAGLGKRAKGRIKPNILSKQSGRRKAAVAPSASPQVRKSATPLHIEFIQKQMEIEETKAVLCTQCLCEGDKMPCEVCIANDHRCRGSCPCCGSNEKVYLRTEDKTASPLAVAVCPRCLCKPDAGSCDVCLKITEERNAAASTSKALSSSSAKRELKKRNTPRKAIYHKIVSAEEIYGKASKPATVFKYQDWIRYIKYINPMIEEYCLHCACISGKEPCDYCRRKGLRCYGSCACCIKYNKGGLIKIFSEHRLHNSSTSYKNKEGKAKMVSIGVQTDFQNLGLDHM